MLFSSSRRTAAHSLDVSFWKDCHFNSLGLMLWKGSEGTDFFLRRQEAQLPSLDSFHRHIAKQDRTTHVPPSWAGAKRAQKSLARHVISAALLFVLNIDDSWSLQSVISDNCGYVSAYLNDGFVYSRYMYVFYIFSISNITNKFVISCSWCQGKSIDLILTSTAW